VVLLTDLRSEADAVPFADAVHRAFREPFKIQGSDVRTSASIGIALGDAECASPDEIIRDADTAMYHAKAAGGAGHIIFDRAMRAHVVARLQLESDIRCAIQDNAIGIVYQPIVCVQTGRAVAVEALVRWSHPQQ